MNITVPPIVSHVAAALIPVLQLLVVGHITFVVLVTALAIAVAGIVRPRA